MAGWGKPGSIYRRLPSFVVYYFLKGLPARLPASSGPIPWATSTAIATGSWRARWSSSWATSLGVSPDSSERTDPVLREVVYGPGKIDVRFIFLERKKGLKASFLPKTRFLVARFFK